MPQRILQMFHALNTDTAQAGGYTITGLSIWSIMIEWVSDITINDVFQGIMFIGSAIFMLFKAYNSYLDSKGKRLDNKIKKRTLKKFEEEDSQN